MVKRLVGAEILPKYGVVILYVTNWPGDFSDWASDLSKYGVIRHGYVFIGDAFDRLILINYQLNR